MQNFIKKNIPFTIILLLNFTFSCSSYETQAEKTAKQKAASERLNSTNQSSDQLFKEMSQ
jgi:hypothetical protein